MSNDLLITPASRKLELKDSSGNVDAVIETDGSGNLSITNAGGSITIGTASTNLNMPGNLVITGDINSNSVTDLDVTDKTITLGVGQTSANSGDSGIVIDGSSAELKWKQGDAVWNFNKDVRIEDTVTPALFLADTGNGAGGGASGKLIFKNTVGNVMGIGYTSDVTTDSDMIISTNGGGTYGGYLGLDASAITDTQADIILDPKTGVRILKDLTVGTTTASADIHLHVDSASATTNNTGLTIGLSGSYSDGRYEHRFRKRDEGGGIPLYIDRSDSVANTHTQIVRFGPYTNNPEEFEVYGDMKATGSITTTDGSGTLVISGDSSANHYFASGGEFRFRPSGTTVNKFVVKANGDLTTGTVTGHSNLVFAGGNSNTSIYRTGGGSGFHFTTNAIYPTGNDGQLNNGVVSLGGASNKFSNLYLSDQLLMNGDQIVSSTGVVKAHDSLFVGSKTGSTQTPKKVLDIASNSSNTERGPWNPIVSSIRNSGYRLHPDEDFRDGFNSVSVYNNSGGGVVSIHHEDATTNSGGAAPNASGKVIRINHNGGTSSPGFGGFVQNIPSEDNHTFVQIFQAKLRTGSTLVIAENAQGTNNRSYFLTDNAGTGKWEWYARVSHCGQSGTFSSGGHIYVTGGSGNFNWYLASCTVYNVTESHFGQINVGDGGSTQANIHIRKADNNVSDHIVFYNGTTRIGEIGCHDTTWLRINQSTNKNIYTPRYIRADAGFFVDGAAKGIDGSGNFVGGTITGASDANVTNWDAAYNDKINSASFNTGNGIITLNQQDGGTVTVDIDGRFLTSEADTLDTVCDRSATTNQTITAGNLISGGYVLAGNSGDGKIALTQNDGQGNANVTFNHQNGVPDKAGNCFRIVTNVDSTTSPQMNFEMLANNTTGSSVNTLSAMEIEPTTVDIPYQLRHMGDTNTSLQFDADRIRLIAGGTTQFDSNSPPIATINGTTNEIDVSTSGTTSTIGIVSNPTLTGNATITGDLLVSGNQIELDNIASRVKYSVWSGKTTYGIGMQNTITGGGIANDYAMTFQMSNTDARGFWFGDSSHTLAQHAMTITTTGRVNIASGLRVGFGEADTTQAGATGIHVKGALDVDDGVIALAGNPNAIHQSGTTLTIGDADENDDVTQLNFKSEASTALALTGTDATFGGNLMVPHYIYHSGDLNSYIRFPAADDFMIVSGGRELVRLDEGANPDIAKFMTDEFRMYSDGNFHADADVFAFSTSTGSDIRLKENVRPLENCLEKVLKLDGVIFDWKKENRGINQYGFIAQQVEEHVPELVKEVEGFEDEGQIKALNYEGVIPMLVEAMKEQQNIINRLEERIKILEGEDSGDN